MLKLVLVSQSSCFPCKALKMIIEQPENMKTLEEKGFEFEYLNLDELEDREAFTEQHGISATPFTLFKTNNQVLAKKGGKQNFQEILEVIDYIKEGERIED